MSMIEDRAAQDSSPAQQLHARALDEAAVVEIAREFGAADVIGIGESTRFARETFTIRERLTWELVREHGFRLLAVQDSANAGERMDLFVRTGAGSAESALETAWRPHRTAEMAGALEWIREFNLTHTEDPVQIIGVQPPKAGSADYDAVVDAVRAAAPDRLSELAGHLDPIRTVHTIADEHVQRARGIHPGRPFAEHARDAAALLESLAGISEEVRARMRFIVEFHEQSVAGRGSFVGGDEPGAGRIMAEMRRTGRRAVYWDGISHTAAAPAGLGLADGSAAHSTVGSVLREHYGPGYASIAIGFHHGNLGVAQVPDPAPDFLDALLGEIDLPVLWADLRGAGGPAVEPAKLRVISGVYDPARDAAEHMLVASPAAAFDVLIHVREASPVRWLE
ncbi:erythromycin esterase family protein [Nocardia sp. NPDC051030]|uniref:erythromycin esterase family protein n=1 Tax=Nocardia sp. NPDC051030 TaxID=3155162 RepID=UPI00341F65A4